MTGPTETNSTAPAAIRLKIGGMTCQNCVRHVREALQATTGVRAVEVDLARGEARVAVEAGTQPAVGRLIEKVRAAGFDAEELPAADSSPAGRRWNTSLLLGLAVTAFLMLGEWVFGWHHAAWFRWTAFALGTVVQFYAGGPFYRGAWRQLKQGQSSMDTLVALGSTTAYGLSVAVLFPAVAGTCTSWRRRRLSASSVWAIG